MGELDKAMILRIFLPKLPFVHRERINRPPGTLIADLISHIERKIASISYGCARRSGPLQLRPFLIKVQFLVMAFLIGLRSQALDVTGCRRDLNFMRFCSWRISLQNL